MKDIHYDLMFNTVWDIFRNNYKCLIDIHLMHYVYLMIINIDEKIKYSGSKQFCFVFVCYFCVCFIMFYGIKFTSIINNTHFL